MCQYLECIQFGFTGILKEWSFTKANSHLVQKTKQNRQKKKTRKWKTVSGKKYGVMLNIPRDSMAHNKYDNQASISLFIWRHCYCLRASKRAEDVSCYKIIEFSYGWRISMRKKEIRIFISYIYYVSAFFLYSLNFPAPTLWNLNDKKCSLGSEWQSESMCVLTGLGIKLPNCYKYVQHWLDVFVGWSNGCMADKMLELFKKQLY